MWVTAGASTVLGLFALVTGIGRVPQGTGEWWPVAGMGLFTASAFLGLFIGLRRLGAVRASIIAALEPVATALLALWVLGEPVRPLTAVGGGLIVAAAGVAALARGRDAPEPVVP
jgi:drug/metabolite transporter (DMT)-like permease